MSEVGPEVPSAGLAEIKIGFRDGSSVVFKVQGPVDIRTRSGFALAEPAASQAEQFIHERWVAKVETVPGYAAYGASPDGA